jgi:hypothetical protein
MVIVAPELTDGVGFELYAADPLRIEDHAEIRSKLVRKRSGI